MQHVDVDPASASVEPQSNGVGPMENDSQIYTTTLSSISQFPGIPGAVGESSSTWLPFAPNPLTIATVSTQSSLPTAQNYMTNRIASLPDSQNFGPESTSTINVLAAHDMPRNTCWEAEGGPHYREIHLGYDGVCQWTQSSSCIPALSYPMMAHDPASRANGRRRRGNLPKQITDILQIWLREHLNHPYPSDEQKQMLTRRTGLTLNQVSNGKFEPLLGFHPDEVADRLIIGLSMLAAGTFPT